MDESDESWDFDASEGKDTNSVSGFSESTGFDFNESRSKSPAKNTRRDSQKSLSFTEETHSTGSKHGGGSPMSSASNMSDILGGYNPVEDEEDLEGLDDGYEEADMDASAASPNAATARPKHEEPEETKIPSPSPSEESLRPISVGSEQYVEPMDDLAFEDEEDEHDVDAAETQSVGGHSQYSDAGDGVKNDADEDGAPAELEYGQGGVVEVRKATMAPHRPQDAPSGRPNTASPAPAPPSRRSSGQSGISGFSSRRTSVGSVSFALDTPLLTPRLQNINMERQSSLPSIVLRSAAMSPVVLTAEPRVRQRDRRGRPVEVDPDGWIGDMEAAAEIRLSQLWKREEQAWRGIIVSFELEEMTIPLESRRPFIQERSLLFIEEDDTRNQLTLEYVSLYAMDSEDAFRSSLLDEEAAVMREIAKEFWDGHAALEEGTPQAPDQAWSTNVAPARAAFIARETRRTSTPNFRLGSMVVAFDAAFGRAGMPVISERDLGSTNIPRPPPAFRIRTSVPSTPLNGHKTGFRQGRIVMGDKLF